MIDRTQRILLLVLAVQVVLIALAWAPWSGGGGVSSSRELFPELDTDEVARIEIQQDDQSVVLTREPDGWSVADHGDFPADPEKVRTLIDDVANVRARTPVVRSSRYHDALGVADDGFEARVKLEGEGDDATIADVLLGTSPNVGLRHLRLADDDRVYEVRGFDRWSVRGDPDAWIDKDLLPDVDVAAVKSVRLTNEHGQFHLARSDDGAWVVELADGSPTDEDGATLVEDIAGMRLLAPAGDDAPTFDRSTAAANVEIELGEGPTGSAKTLEVSIGPEMGEDDDRRVVTRSEPNRTVIVSGYEAKRVLDFGAPNESE
jgi:hypothetical protein